MWYYKAMTLLQAVAIIRQKPEGVCVRQYTERLALQFSQLQEDWRGKAVQLQRELLRTRQELTKFQIQADTLGHTNTLRGGIELVYRELCIGYTCGVRGHCRLMQSVVNLLL